MKKITKTKMMPFLFFVTLLGLFLDYAQPFGVWDRWPHCSLASLGAIGY